MADAAADFAMVDVGAAAPAASPNFTTIYDALGAWRADFFDGEKSLDSSKAKLYYKISKLCAGFAIADLRHDFTDELNINIFIDATSRQSIGLFQIRQICGAYYALNSPRFNDLYESVRKAYVTRMTSDTAAKAYIEKQTLKFFSAVFPALRGDYFKETSYAKLIENSQTLTAAPYETDAQKDAILAKLKPTERPIILDAQMGNPNQYIFSYYSHKNKDSGGSRATYLYNFATVLDAAEKLTTDVHKYMNVYMQNTVSPKELTIPPHIGSYMHTNIISAPNYNTKIRDWEVSSKFVFGGRPSAGAGRGATTYERTFSSTDKASVNVLGLIPTRGRAVDAETKAAAREALNLKFVNPMHVSVNHQFKSTGDRYQVYSASASFREKSIEGFYKSHGDLRQPPSPTDPQINLPITLTVRPIIVTNDILNKYQCYFFQVDTLFTESKAVTFIDYSDGEIITSESVRKSITIAIINKVYSNIQNSLTVSVDISDPKRFLASLYNAVSARRLGVVCENVPFLKKFLGAVPPNPEELQRMITKENASVFYSYIMGDIASKLRQSVGWTDTQNESFVTMINTYIVENKLGVSSLSEAAQRVRLYNAIMCHIEAIQYYLSNMLIENHTDILSHLIFLMFGGKEILTVYKDIHIVMGTLLNPRRGTVLSDALTDVCDLHNYNREQALKDLAPILYIVEGYAPTGKPSYLGELTNVLRTCQLTAAKKEDFLPVYAALDPIILSSLQLKLLGHVVNIPGYQKILLREILAANSFVVADEDMEMVAVAPARPAPLRRRGTNKNKGSTNAAKKTQKNTVPRPPLAGQKRSASDSTDAYEALSTLTQRSEAPAERLLTGIKPIGLTAVEGEQYMIRNSDHLKRSALETHTVFTRMKGFIRHLPEAISRKAQDIYANLYEMFRRVKGGGTRSASASFSRASLYNICEQKLELMCMMIGQPRMAFAGMYLFTSFNQLNLIRKNMLAAKRRSRSIALSVPVQVSTTKKTTGGGGDLSNASTITAEEAIQEASNTLPFQEASSTPTLSVSMKRSKALNLIHKQLLSFLFAGFTRDYKGVIAEKGILGKYLPVIVRDEISSTHNQLFWHPLFNRVTADYDEFAALHAKILRELTLAPKATQSPKSPSPKKTLYTYGKTIRAKLMTSRSPSATRRRTRRSKSS